MKLTSSIGSRSHSKCAFGIYLSLAILLLLFSGYSYRVVSGKYQSLAFHLEVPLRHFPLQFNGWVGQDIPIPEVVQKIAGNDDFFNRSYEYGNQFRFSDQRRVSIYVPFTATPRTMLGHRPQKCYVERSPSS